MQRIYATLMLLTIISCNSSGFTENADSDTGIAPVVVGGSEDCIEGDQIKFDFPQDIQSCIDQQKLYSFSTSSCLEVKSSSFDCSFGNITSAVDKIGVSITSIQSAQEQGALLVSCGEKNSGQTIVAQWFYPPEQGSCDFNQDTSARIVTACYKLYVQSDPPPTDTPEQRAVAVKACLEE